MERREAADNVTINGEKISTLEQNGHSETQKRVSKLRQALPQCCAVGAKNLLLLTFGSTLGFSTILIPELTKENAEPKVSMEELTWISSLNLFLVPIGCFVSGPISQLLGRRKTMMLANIPFVVAWVMFHYASSSGMLFAALALTGVTGGLLEAPVMTYVAEVTQPHLRGMLSATSTMAVILGVFTQMLGGKLATWRTVAMVNLAYPILCFLALVMVPESPHWLAAKGRLKDSEKALCWLRGWVPASQVSGEFKALKETVQKPVEATGEKESKWKIYCKRTCYKPFILVSLAFFVGAFGGTATLQTFAVLVFASLNAPIDKYTAAVFLGVAELVGTLVCVLTIHFIGKRKLTFLSVAGTGFAFFFTAVYGYLADARIVDLERYSWLPTTLLIGAAFLSHMGIRLMPWILAGEVFPVQVRSSATGAAGSIGYIFTSIANKIFLYMVNGMSLAGTFIFYAAMNIIGGVILYFILPETEGRTLREIEEHYAGIQSLKNRPRKETLQFKEKWAATNTVVVCDDNESKL
ncbi:facilitated trehalose transporter Tret1-like [Prorops nasuta]|uniref:facilitated trehalose transporter Tret1-like n=1 Tax=Prorops nasuta TaxID=863751 RepID=UPI0034CEAC80